MGSCSSIFALFLPGYAPALSANSSLAVLCGQTALFPVVIAKFGFAIGAVQVADSELQRCKVRRFLR